MPERHSGPYCNVPEALALLDDCERDGLRVLAIEGFLIGPTYTRPLMDEIYVFESGDVESVAFARKFLLEIQVRHAHQPDLMVLVVIDD